MVTPNPNDIQEPSLEQVNDFHINNFPAITDSLDLFPPMERPQFNRSKDQIIRGWLYREKSKRDLVHMKEEPERAPLNILTLIPENERQYPGFDDWFDHAAWERGEIFYGVIFVKGHGLDKKLFFDWHREVVFFCPHVFQNGGDPAQLREEVEVRQQPVTNRFMGDKFFRHLDQRRKRWLKFPFSQIGNLDRNFELQDDGSHDCPTGTTIAINRLR